MTDTTLELIEKGICPTCQSEYSNRYGVIIHHPRAHGSQAIPDDALLDELHRLADERGRSPTIAEMDSHGEYSSDSYLDRFGGWNSALKRAGLTPRKRQGISKEDLLSEIHRLHSELGNVPTTSDLSEHGAYSTYPYSRQFGGWCNALEEAGFEPPNPQESRSGAAKQIPTEDLLEEIHRLHEEIGDVPRTEDMVAHGQYSKGTYQSRFGGWNNALEAAGYGLNCKRGIGPDDLLAEIVHLYEQFGRVPRYRELLEHGQYSMSPYQDTFGGWNQAIEAAGFEPWAQKGEDNPIWNGGPVDYGPGWNEEKRKVVRERDDWQCQNCGRHEADHIDLFGTKLHVHHIIKARCFADGDPAANDKDNLVSLCQNGECHPKWELMSPLRPQVEVMSRD